MNSSIQMKYIQPTFSIEWTAKTRSKKKKKENKCREKWKKIQSKHTSGEESRILVKLSKCQCMICGTRVLFALMIDVWHNIELRCLWMKQRPSKLMHERQHKLAYCHCWHFFLLSRFFGACFCFFSFNILCDEALKIHYAKLKMENGGEKP